MIASLLYPQVKASRANELVIMRSTHGNVSSALTALYRNRYKTCKGTYALTVPFMERFFQFAKPNAGNQTVGWVGQITSNSFMKREFGNVLSKTFCLVATSS